MVLSFISHDSCEQSNIAAAFTPLKSGHLSVNVVPANLWILNDYCKSVYIYIKYTQAVCAVSSLCLC